MENLNLLFYKTFYTKLGQGKAFETDVQKKADALVKSKFFEKDYKSVCSEIAPNKFMMKTAYPGLLAGTGYAHGVDVNDDVKVGFSFDFVTGQPYIPGSSVKGLLRSYFAHPDVIRTFLNDEKLDVRALEKSIFGSKDDDSEDGVDVFFDVVVKCGDKKGQVMGFDAITPHGEDLTKSPNPLKIVKIMPDVVLEFSFNLKDSVIGEKPVTVEQKMDLFKKIITHFGIGAKTNVGYGVLTEVDESGLNAYPHRSAASSDNPNISRASDPRRREAPSVSTLSGNEQPVENNCYNCTVTGVKDFGIFVKIDSTRFSGLIHSSKLGIPGDVAPNEYFVAGDRVIARFLSSTKKGLSFALVSKK